MIDRKADINLVVICTAPTCTDGFQNGEEEGVDCGGKCRACRSCGSAPLKALGHQYRLQGTGVTHMSNRTISCASGFERLSGPERDVIYCNDGLFTKNGLQCGEPRIEVVKGTLRLLEGQYLDHTSLPSIHSALRTSLHVSLPNELRISSAGDCGEMAGLSKFVCVDNPAVQTTGFDCSLLSRVSNMIESMKISGYI